MVGEIRDRDTAEIAIHAALTGHLVLSTLHTNDALGAVARLIDMGVEPFLLSSTLLGVIGQRLLRRVCQHCQEGHRPEPSLKARYPQLTVVTRGRGCRFCRQTGFQGRFGVFEVFTVAQAVASAIAARAPIEELRRLAGAAGMRSMREDGMAKVQQGLTTLEELDRVVPAYAERMADRPDGPGAGKASRPSGSRGTARG
jgi:type II secretory ATPase GspE/PulE/Tfp pilus assembly ATPase PilB-like protein